MSIVLVNAYRFFLEVIVDGLHGVSPDNSNIHIILISTVDATRVDFLHYEVCDFISDLHS